MPSFTRQEFKALYMDQRERIYRLLRRLCGNAQDAEDLLQETFMVVWRKREVFEGRGAPEGFVRTTAIRLFLNSRQVRDRRPKAQSTEEWEGESDQAMAGEDHASSPTRGLEDREALRFLIERVEESLACLPDAVREVFVLFRYEGLTCAEISELTRAPVKTVETRLRRATLALAEKLKPFRSLLPAS